MKYPALFSPSKSADDEYRKEIMNNIIEYGNADENGDADDIKWRC